MKTKSIIHRVFLGLLAIQLVAGCSTLQRTTVSLPSPVISAPTEPQATFEVTPTKPLVRTKADSTSTPTKTETQLPPDIAFLEDCPTVTSQISKGLDEDLYLYLEGKALYQYIPLSGKLSPFAKVDLNTTLPLHLSPDGKMFYWVKDGTLILFDVDRAKITATFALPEGSGHGAGWTNDGNIRLDRLDITEDSDLTGVAYTILHPTDFHIIKQQTYDLVHYPHFAVSMKYGGFVAVSPDGSKVLYSGLEKQVNYVFLYDIVQKQILWKSEGFNWINDLGGIPATTIWTNDGKWAIFAAARKEPYRILFAISADGTVFKELAVLDNKIFEGELRSFQISGDQEYIFFSLWDTLAHINESSAAVAGKGYLLDIEKRVIKTVCLKDQLFFNGVFHRDSFIYNVFNPQSKKVEVWVLKPKLWQTEKLFEFSTDGVYYVLGKNFALR